MATVRPDAGYNTPVGMTSEDWDARYRGAAYVWTADPNRFVVEQVRAAALLPGDGRRALDFACGEGRNAVWLAEQGFAATGVDFSASGLDKGRRLAVDRGVEVEWVCADVTSWDPPDRAFDLVVVAYLQLAVDDRRAALARAVGALAPGVTLVVVAHDSANLTEGTGGPQDPAFLYTPGDIVADLTSAGLAAGVAVAVDDAGTRPRPVDGEPRPALDAVVRAHRRESP